MHTDQFVHTTWNSDEPIARPRVGGILLYSCTAGNASWLSPGLQCYPGQLLASVLRFHLFTHITKLKLCLPQEVSVPRLTSHHSHIIR